MKRIIAGLGSLIVVLALVVGIPVVLVLVAGNPIPSWTQITDAIAIGDLGGRFLIGNLLPIGAWIAWAIFTVPFLHSIPGAIRDARDGIRARETHGAFGMQRRAASVLIGAIVMMSVGTTAAIAAPAAHANNAPQTITQQVAAETPAPAPAPVVETPAPAPQLEQHTVAPGDTLWDIAEDELGDGARYPEVFNASAGTIQPDGQQLTDPDLILPGWQVSIPGTAVAAPASTPESTPPADPAPAQAPDSVDTAPGADPTADQAETGAAGGAGASVDEATTPETTAAPVPEASAAPVPAEDNGLGFSTAARAEGNGEADDVDEQTVAVTADVIDDGDDFEFNAMAAGGIAGILAAGILGALGVRRALQRRKRRFAERIAMPTPEISALELELRAVETPNVMDEVDQALRYLAAWAATNGLKLPELYAVRLATDATSLFLDEPADLPLPFVQASDDRQAWALPNGALATIELEDFASPYPALVTLGRDALDGLILIDLEHWGAVNVIGDAELTHAALTALALELGSTRWGDQLQVTLVGVASDVASALRARHVRKLDTAEELLTYLNAQVADTRAALATTPHATPAEARRAGSDEAWLPEIVILGEEASPQIRAELAEIVSLRPRLGIAAVAAGTIAEGATITIDSAEHATFAPAGVEFKPQLVNDHTLREIVELFDTTDAPAARTDTAPADTFDSIIGAQARHAAPEPAEPQPEAEPAAAVNAEPAATPVALAEPEPAVGVVDEAEPAAAMSAPEPADAAVDIADEASVKDQEHPYIRLLGPVAIDVPSFDPATSRTPPGRGLELAAFLALHPNATSDEFASAFWPLKTRQQATESMKKLTSTTRSWLGVAADGELYFPRYTAADGYRVQGVRTDWGVFQELIGPDLSQTPDEQLVEALRLVRGQPFTGVSDRFWAWSALDKEDMIAAIADAADELFRRADKAQDHLRAQYAATLGNAVAPENEGAWRNMLLAALRRGDVAEFEKVTQRLYAFLDGFEEGYEPEPETQALIDQGRRELIHA